MKILGIETSCDETAASVLECSPKKTIVRSHIVYSQVAHEKTAGIVPEVAAREHVLKLPEVITLALNKSKTTLRQLRGIAVTKGPGLITSLLVGVETAKTISYLTKKPLIGVNHLEGHVYSGLFNTTYRFPLLALLVSGGHTELVLMNDHGKYQLLGRTRDDAAGEAFDKVAVLLGLGYPGGAKLAALAKKGTGTAVPFPRPMIDTPDFDFSFSGLKTAVRYAIEGKTLTTKKKSAIAASFQEAVVDVLVAKTLRAAKMHHVHGIILGGGVAANLRLRTRLRSSLKKEMPKAMFFPSPQRLTGDNATMIAFAGYQHLRNKQHDDWQTLTADPSLQIV